MSTERYFWLYLLECENGKFYTGYTKNLAIRYYQHKKGKQSARYTKSFKPVRIAQCWRLFDNISTALKIEYYIKKKSKTIKKHWVQNPDELRKAISKKLGLALKLFPFDSRVVEKESEKMDWKKIRNGWDPFADEPIPKTQLKKT